MRTAKDRQSAPPAPLVVNIDRDDFSRQDAAARKLQNAAKSPDFKARRRTLPPNATAAAAA